MRSKVLVRIDRLLVKPVPVAVKMMPDAEMEPLYDGAKKMILVDDVDNRQFLCELVESINQITETAIIHPVIDRLLTLPDKQI